MSKQTFPIYLYNAAGAVSVCDNLEQVDRARSKGFTSNYRPVAWPKTVYNSVGAVAVAKDEDHLKTLQVEGFTEGYVALPAAPEPAASSGNVGGSPDFIRAVFAEISELRQRVEALEAAITEPRAAKDAKKDKNSGAAQKE